MLPGTGARMRQVSIPAASPFISFRFLVFRFREGDPSFDSGNDLPFRPQKFPFLARDRYLRINRFAKCEHYLPIWHSSLSAPNQDIYAITNIKTISYKYNNRWARDLPRGNHWFCRCRIRPDKDGDFTMNMNKLTQKSQEALQDAHSEALDRNHQEVDAEHLLLALLDQENGLVCRLLQRAGAPPADVRRKLEAALSRRPRLSGGVSDVRMARSLHEVLVKAEKEADRLKDEFVSVEHLALAILAGDGEAAKTLQEHGVGRDGLLRALSAVRGNQRVTSANPEDSYEALEKYGVDLVAQARAGKLDPVIGRDGEIRRVIRILSRKTKNNPVLIGEPGVGKTAVVEGLAQRIVRGDVPEWMKERTIFSLDMGALISGARWCSRKSGRARDASCCSSTRYTTSSAPAAPRGRPTRATC